MTSEKPSASHPVQPHVRHQLDHEVPTVIHHPEDDMTALGRWFHRAYQDPNRFWGWAVTVVIGVIAAVILANYFSSARSTSSDVWSRLEEAKKPAEKVELAKENATSPASTWALLQAATEYYQDGFNDLPNNKDVAGPALKKALDLFTEVAEKAPKDSPLRRHAILGMARTHEARYELPKAIEQYKLVSKTWPGSHEAKQADTFVTSLEAPGAAEFYKQLYAYQPAKASLPPVAGDATLPSLDFSKMGLDAGTLGTPGSAGSSPFPFLPSPPPSTKAADPLPPLSTPDTKPKVEEKPAPKPAPVEPAKEKASTPPPAAKPEAKPEIVKPEVKPEAPKPAPASDAAKGAATPAPTKP